MLLSSPFKKCDCVQPLLSVCFVHSGIGNRLKFEVLPTSMMPLWTYFYFVWGTHIHTFFPIFFVFFVISSVRFFLLSFFPVVAIHIADELSLSSMFSLLFLIQTIVSMCTMCRVHSTLGELAFAHSSPHSQFFFLIGFVGVFLLRSLFSFIEGIEKQWHTRTQHSGLFKSFNNK